MYKLLVYYRHESNLGGEAGKYTLPQDIDPNELIHAKNEAMRIGKEGFWMLIPEIDGFAYIPPQNVLKVTCMNMANVTYHKVKVKENGDT